MNIVVLDGYILNPGDLSWRSLEELAPVAIYERTEEALIPHRAAGAQIVLTNKTPLSAQTLRLLPDARYVGVLATGYNIVDVRAARKLGITVTNVPTYGTASVAQFTFALLLELCHHVKLHSEVVLVGEWSRSPDWCFWRTPLIELAGKTLGVIGLGRIGRRVAEIAEAFGMEVIFTNGGRSNQEVGKSEIKTSLEELLSRADVVSLHCPLVPETQGMMNDGRLRLMKPSAFLINTSRGPLVVDQDLADALNAGRLAGAAVDVLSVEPPVSGNPLIGAKNCLVTPHIAWATREARGRLLEVGVANVAAFLRGKPENVVS
jgi:glycerate dehydrogenase